MNKLVELPLVEPIYSTYQYQGSASAVLSSNPSIRNWYLNQIFILTCNRKFLRGFTSPQVSIKESTWGTNPYLEKQWFNMEFLKGYSRYVIHYLIDAGFYVTFNGIDDYYMQGKCFYHERHFKHDGLICGYNRDEKTYCLYGYDSNWIYRKFWMPQHCFEEGRRSMFKEGIYGMLCGIRPKETQVDFSCETAITTMKNYLNSTMELYPEESDEPVYGIVVHSYLAKYIGMLYDGSIPYEKMDKRVLRLIWEHKRVMQERLLRIEESLGWRPEISEQYQRVVKESNDLRMLYAAYHMKRRDSVLPTIQKGLLNIGNTEERLLHELLDKYERKL